MGETAGNGVRLPLSGKKNNTMKARIRFSSNEETEIKEVETIDDLLKLKLEYGNPFTKSVPLIIQDKPLFEEEEFDLYIEVYDDWRE